MYNKGVVGNLVDIWFEQILTELSSSQTIVTWDKWTYVS